MKVVVITGSTRGIGYGLAETFLARDCAVVISGRSQDAVDRAVAALGAAPDQDRLLGRPCDVTQADQVQALWDAAVARFGRVDIWINNAGQANRLAALHELSPDELAALVETNVLGLMYGCRVALRGMQAQGFGALYNMEGRGSDGALQDGLTAYGTSKYAVRYLNKALAKEVAALPGNPTIIAGALQPGMLDTDLVRRQLEAQPEQFDDNKRILNIIMDRVETVAPWLADQILANQKNGARIAWLSRRKLLGRFLLAPFSKRQILT